jgi:hypothetical protein
MNSVTNRNPNKTNAKEHMPIFVDRLVTGETFTEMGVEAYFVTKTEPAPKHHRSQHC